MHQSSLIQTLFFIGFIVVIVAMLAIDMGVLEKKDKVIGMRRALKTTLVWMALACCFGVFIYFFGHDLHGVQDKEGLIQIAEKYHHRDFANRTSQMDFSQAARLYNQQMTLEYFTGYIIEYSLSIDNIFVMILMFTTFSIDPKYYKRVLMWGIIGAMLMRFAFIFGAGALIAKYEWVLIIFGLGLMYSGIKMYLQRNKEEDTNPENNAILRFCKKHFRTTNTITDHSFIKKIDGKRYITPLFLCMVTIEFTDVLFAVDSIPAVFSITKDPYIVFFSNIFAIMGLRSLFFLVSGMMQRFKYLNVGLALLLFIIGVKMILESNLIGIEIPISISLGIIAGIISVSILCSILVTRKQ